MQIRYSKRRWFEADVGNLVKYVLVSGQQFLGIILGVTCAPSPKDITYLRVLTTRGEEIVNAALIWRIEVLC